MLSKQQVVQEVSGRRRLARSTGGQADRTYGDYEKRLTLRTLSGTFEPAELRIYCRSINNQTALSLFAQNLAEHDHQMAPVAATEQQALLGAWRVKSHGKKARRLHRRGAALRVRSEPPPAAAARPRSTLMTQSGSPTPAADLGPRRCLWQLSCSRPKRVRRWVSQPPGPIWDDDYSRPAGVRWTIRALPPARFVVIQSALGAMV